jgi:hypothetical protein
VVIARTVLPVWWRRVLGTILVAMGCFLALGSVLLSVSEAQEDGGDLATTVEAGILLFVLCLLPAAFGYRLAKDAKRHERRHDARN